MNGMKQRLMGDFEKVSKPERKLQQCGSFRQKNTTYNDLKDIPPYAGVMFEMFAKIEIEILTLEVDVRMENTTDLYVEVYVVDGGFSTIVSNESAWQLVAQTTMVLAPEGVGAIIPVNDFRSFQMPRRTKKSLYITMRERTIDFTANALQKTGEVHIDGDDFDILVGAGLAEYKFPKKIDPVLDPQFSGVIHYRTATDSCDTETLLTTEIEFKLLFGVEANPEFIQSLNSITDSVVEQVLHQHQALMKYKELYNLTIKENAQTELISFTGKCPTDWPVCPPSYEKIVVKLSHKDSLSGGSVKLEFLREYETIVGAMQSSFPSNIQSIYLGDRSVSIQYSMSLNGAPAIAMDSIQEKYFVDVGTTFIDLIAIPRFSSVLVFVVDTQDGQIATLRQRQLQDKPTNRIRGKIHGSLPAAFASDHFQETLNIAFRDTNRFIDMLKISGLRPSQITENNRISYFMGISGISVEFEEIVQETTPTAVESADNSLSNASIAMIEGAAFILFLIGVTWSAHKYRKGQKEKREAKEKRQLRRDELRIEKEARRPIPEATSSVVSATETSKHIRNHALAKTERKPLSHTNELKREGQENNATQPATSPKLNSNEQRKPDIDNFRSGLVKSFSESNTNKNATGVADVNVNAAKVQPKASAIGINAPITFLSQSKLSRSQSTSVIGASMESETKKNVLQPEACKTQSADLNNNQFKSEVNLSKLLTSGTQNSRPSMVRSQSSSVLVSTKKSPEIAFNNVKASTTESNKAVVPIAKPIQRPTFARSQSTSVLQSVLDAPVKVIGASDVPPTSKAASCTTRPGLVKSQSNSILTTQKPMNNLLSARPDTTSRPVAALTAPRPALARTMSCSVLPYGRLELKDKTNKTTLSPRGIGSDVTTRVGIDDASKIDRRSESLPIRPIGSQSSAILQVGLRTNRVEPKILQQPPSSRPVLPKNNPINVPCTAESVCATTAAEFARSESSSILHTKPVLQDVPGNATLVLGSDDSKGLAREPATFAVSGPSLVPVVGRQSQVSQTEGNEQPVNAVYNGTKVTLPSTSRPTCPSQSSLFKPKIPQQITDSQPDLSQSSTPSTAGSGCVTLAVTEQHGLARIQSSSILHTTSVHPVVPDDATLVTEPDDSRGLALEAAKLAPSQPLVARSHQSHVSQTGNIGNPVRLHPTSRPSYPRSQSSSVLQGSPSKPTMKPVIKTEPLKDKPGVVESVQDINGSQQQVGVMRPPYQRSQSISVLQAKNIPKPQNTMKGLTGEEVSCKNISPSSISEASRVVAASLQTTARPVFPRSQSCSILLTKTVLPAVADKATEPGENQDRHASPVSGPNGGVASTVSKSGSSHAPAVRRLSQVSCTGDAGSATNAGRNLTLPINKTIVNLQPMPRPSLSRCLSTSTLQANPPIPSTKPVLTTGPRMLTIVQSNNGKSQEKTGVGRRQRSQSISLLQTKAPPGISNPHGTREEANLKSNDHTYPAESAPHASTVRPLFVRSQSSSILLTKPVLAATVRGNAPLDMEPGKTRGQNASQISGLLGVPGKAITVAKPALSNPTAAGNHPSVSTTEKSVHHLNRPSNETKSALPSVVRPVFPRSQSVSVFKANTSIPPLEPVLKTEEPGVLDGAHGNNGRSQQPMILRPGFQRSQSISVLQTSARPSISKFNEETSR